MAPGTTAPEGSVTVPVIRDVAVWAINATAENKTRTSSKELHRMVLDIVISLRLWLEGLTVVKNTVLCRRESLSGIKVNKNRKARGPTPVFLLS
jgi:hypothetical protein